MTENKANNGIWRACQPLKRFSCLALSCSILALSGCENISMPSFGGEKETIQTETENLRNEVSYAKEKSKGLGYNPKNIFGRSLRSEKERLDRLERAVQDMRNEFDSVRPSITRLVSLEGEIQRLIRELKALNDEATPAPTPTVKQQPIQNYTPPAQKNVIQQPKKSTYQKKAPPPVQNGSASVYDLRIGEHPGRTRLVMDVNSKTNYSVDIDNAENIAIIELPNAGWTAAKSKSLGKSNFISSYKVEASGEGHILILQLKRDAKVTYKDDLPGTKGSSRRLVIDLQGS